MSLKQPSNETITNTPRVPSQPKTQEHLNSLQVYIDGEPSTDVDDNMDILEPIYLIWNLLYPVLRRIQKTLLLELAKHWSVLEELLRFFYRIEHIESFIERKSQDYISVAKFEKTDLRMHKK